MREQIPDLLLEQYRLDEVDPGTRRRIESDPDAQERLSALEEDSRAILAQHPAPWFADQVRRRVDAEKRTERPVARVRSALREHPWVLPAMAAAVFVLALLPFQLGRSPVEGAGEIQETARGERIKGMDASLTVFRSADGGVVEELIDGSLVRDGDRLQIAYSAAGAPYGVIFSVDGNGVVTLHHPESFLQASALEQGGSTALPYGYVLDDAPRFERFYFVTADHPIDVSGVIDAVTDVAPDDTAVRRVLNRWQGGDLTVSARLTLQKDEGRLK